MLFPEAFLQRVQLIALAKPSMVKTSEPSAWTAKTVQEFALSPLNSNVQGPEPKSVV
jgi:hypothetical protein